VSFSVLDVGAKGFKEGIGGFGLVDFNRFAGRKSSGRVSR
jgi:hypothetical protein